MRISLLHNEEAGSAVASQEICEAIDRHGHRVIRVVADEDDRHRLLDDEPDLVVAAGGDGTVAVAARVVAGHSVPLAVLPLGTANNIASILRLERTQDELIAAWRHGQRLPFDLGVCRGAWGESVFLESVGCGVMAIGMSTMQARAADENEEPANRVTRAARTYREVLATINASPLRVVLDGVPIQGEFMLVEVLNTPSIGPNLFLSEEADPSDGLFSVVLGREDDREEIGAHLDLRVEGALAPPALPTKRARTVVIETPALVHVDGVVHADPGVLNIRIEPAALSFLV